MNDIKKRVFDYIKSNYHDEPEYPWNSYPDDGVFRDKLSKKWYVLFMKVASKSLGLKAYPNEYVDVINVKGESDFISLFVGSNGYLPAYHMNKRHWFTILLDGSVSFDKIKDCIDRSYMLITDTPSKRIYEAVKKIPRGKVATYGMVAQLAGEKNMARAVGNALHNNPDPENIPCYRVVNSKGELSGSFAFGGAYAQAELLVADGIEVINNKVDLSKYGIIADELS